MFAIADPSTGMVMVSSPSGRFSAETHLDVLVDGVLLQVGRPVGSIVRTPCTRIAHAVIAL